MEPAPHDQPAVKSEPSPTAVPGKPAPVIHQAVPDGPSKANLTLNKRQTQWLAGAALALLAAALGYLVWYKPHQPDMVLANALMKTMQLQSAHVALTATMPDSATLTGSGGFSTDSTGAKGGFQLAGTYATSKGNLGYDLRSTDGKDIYLKATGLKSISSLLGEGAAQYGISDANNPFQSLDDTWLVISKDTQDLLLKDSKLSTPGVQLGDSDKRKLASLYEQHRFLHVTKTMADETIGGQPSRHFAVRVDQTELTAFAEAVQQQVPSLKVTDQQVDSIRSMYLPSLPVDVWIAKNPAYVTQVGYNGQKTIVKLTLTDFNKPVTIDKPQNAKPFFEALSSVLLGGLGNPEGQGGGQSGGATGPATSQLQ